MRRYVTFVVALALVLRSLLAPGFMLEANAASHTLTVVICTDHGIQLVDLDDAGHPLDTDKSYAGHSTCPYAASTIVAIDGPKQSEAIRLAAPLRQSLTPSSLQVVSRPELPKPARGPPLA